MAAVHTVAKASMGVITRLETHNRELVKALRKLAIAERHRMAYGGSTIKVGGTCKVCDNDWSNGTPETHMASCPLAQTQFNTV